jgi:hypothetical protein
VAALNAALVRVVDLLLAPAVHAAPWLTFAIVAVLTGVGMPWVFARASNQRGIVAAKRRMHAALLEIRLFNDDLSAVWAACGRLLGQNARYLGYSLVPLAWAALPLALLLAQLQAFYGYDGFTVGERVLLTVRLSASAAMPSAGDVALQPMPGIRAEGDAIVFPGAREILWRLVPTRRGDYTLRARVGDTMILKRLHVSADVARRSPVRAAGSVFDALLHPSEPPLPIDGPVVEASVKYPVRTLTVGAWHVHWTIPYVILSMVSALVVARRRGVTL